MAHCSCSGVFDKNRTLSRTLTIDIVGGQATTDNVGTNSRYSKLIFESYKSPKVLILSVRSFYSEYLDINFISV